MTRSCDIVEMVLVENEDLLENVFVKIKIKKANLTSCLSSVLLV